MTNVKKVNVQELKEIVGENKEAVAIYLTQYTMLKGLLFLAKKMVASGYQVIFLIEMNLIPYFDDDHGFIYAITKSDVEHIDFVKVFITLYDATFYGSGVKLPQKPILVACNHSFHTIEPGSDQLALAEGMVTCAYEFDYFISDAAAPTLIPVETYEKAAKRVYRKGDKLRASEQFSVLPAGYFNYDASIRYFETLEEEPYALFYTHKRDNGRWRNEREKIVSTLLDSFPKLTTIYSAGPFEWIYPDRMEMIEKFAKRDNFELGRDKINLIPFAKALICITSDSDTVLTFGISTQRPFIRCNFTGEDSGEILPIQRHDFGYDVFSREQLEVAVAALLEELRSCEGACVDRSKFNCYTPNPGYSCEAFIEYLPYMMRGEQHPDWITFRIPSRFTGTGWTKSGSTNPDFPVIEKPSALAFQMNYSADVPYLRHRSIPLKDSEYVFAPNGPTFMIWGASGGYKDNFRDKLLNTRNNFVGFIERNSSILENGLDGYAAYPSSAIAELLPEFIFVASTYHAEIVDELTAVLDATASKKKGHDASGH